MTEATSESEQSYCSSPEVQMIKLKRAKKARKAAAESSSEEERP